MDTSTTISIILFIFIAFPLSVFIHEFGHAAAILLLTKKKVRIFIGPRTSDNDESFKVGRCHFHLQWSTGGSCFTMMEEQEWTKKITFFFFLFGPLFSFIAASTFILAANMLKQETFWSTVLFWTGYLNAIMFIITLVPIKYPNTTGRLNGVHSDGYELVRLFFQK
ncbi:M50 family metallopeptidase [Evansella halocellulosilytica]|uniref:M50 family metallopeptidase n=1 Tax=Evansella halocellulosilytica TaxID=2011013 RepID=UPI000BB88FC9|nr:M50 family metallopeptidase [Evansella halocellulosilytica]